MQKVKLYKEGLLYVHNTTHVLCGVHVYICMHMYNILSQTESFEYLITDECRPNQVDCR